MHFFFLNFVQFKFEQFAFDNKWALMLHQVLEAQAEISP